MTMAATEGKTPRERYRAQVREEIKERAWEQIGTAGASALSLNAIAKQMGMSGPALYRYFAGRDELITELVRDAYRSLADAFRAAPARAAAAPDSGRQSGPAPAPGPGPEPGPGPGAGHDTRGDGPDLPALAHTLRRWALEDPQRYFLVYGTPVPGYRAPEDTTAIASEIMAVLLDACAALPPADAATPAEADLDVHVEAHRQWAGGHPAPATALRRALTVWTRLHGVLSLELAGHFTGMGFDPERLFAAEVAALTSTAEIPPADVSEPGGAFRH